MEPAGALAEVNAGGGLSIADAYRAVVTGNLDGEKLTVLKQLLAMDAERQFNMAFVALQNDLPQIQATTEIKNRGKYAKFEHVMEKIKPLLVRHGFTVSFSQDCQDKRIVETCTLSHSGGHSRANRFAVRVGPADNDTMSDCKASTTAKRNALLNALNIVVTQDCLTNEDDVSIEGDPNAFVTPEQAGELEHRCKMTDSNVGAFLKFARADKFATIPANRYADLDQLLRRKEQGK